MIDDDFIPPNYFEMLDCTEQALFMELRQELLSILGAPVFNLKLFLNKIETFCHIGESLSYKKMVVCGICWLKHCIAINFNQIKSYLPILKTTMQAQLQEMGYNSSKRDSKVISEITELIPCLKNDPVELKQWVMYKYVAQTPCISFGCFDPTSLLTCSPEPTISPPTPTFYEEKNQKSCDPSYEDVDSFFDDPFSLPPLFLVEDSKKLMRESSAIMI